MLKWIVRVGLALVALVVVAIGAILFLLPSDRIGALAAERIEAATGRSVTFAEGFSPTIWPRIGAATGAFAISNVEGSEEEVFVGAEAASVGLSLPALLSGRIEIEDLSLVAPVIVLEIAEDGTPNWAFGTEETASAPQDTAPVAEDEGGGFELAGISARIERGRLLFLDRRSGLRQEVSDLDLAVGLEGAGRPLVAEGTALWQGKPVALSADVASLDALIAGQGTAIDLEAGFADNALTFTGTAGLGEGALPLVDGAVTLAVPDPDETLVALGQAPIPAAAGAIADIALDATILSGADGLSLELAGRVSRDGTPLTLTGSLAGAADVLETMRLSLDLSLRAGDFATARYDGTLTLQPEPAFSGALSAESGDLARTIAFAAGESAPEGVPGSAALSGTLTGGAMAIDLDDLTITADGQTLSGSAGLSLDGPRPFLRADLAGGRLDLDPFLGGGVGAGEDAGDPPGEGGWSEEPLPLDALSAFDADIALSLAGLRMSPIDLDAVNVALTLRDGALRTDIREVRGFGGAGTGSIRASRSGDIGVTLDLSAVRIEEVLQTFAGIDRLEALGALRVDLSGQGLSMAALMRSLDGSVTLDLGDGAIRGINLAALARNFTDPGAARGEAQRTDFTEAFASFAVRDGVMTTADLSLLGPLVRLAGQGDIGLGAQTLGMRLQPRIVADLQGQGGTSEATGIVLPILVEGTWSDPRIRPDMEALPALQEAQRQVQDQVDAARERVEDEAERAVEDARERVEDAVRGGLQGLLGGGGGGTPSGGGDDAAPDAAENAPAEGQAPAESDGSGGGTGNPLLDLLNR